MGSGCVRGFERGCEWGRGEVGFGVAGGAGQARFRLARDGKAWGFGGDWGCNLSLSG